MSEKLWLHHYSGRENGLMVVGSPAALRELGQQLVTAADTPAEASGERWPAQIAHPASVGPYNDVPEFKLSFHLAGAVSPAEVLPLRRSGPPFAVVLLIVVLAVLGFAEALYWLVSHAL